MTTTTEVFLDTSYFIALSSQADRHHPQARTLARRLLGERTRMVTTVPVLLEVGNGLARRRLRPLAASLLRSVQSDRRVEIVSLTDDLYHAGLGLYLDRTDKDWGLTDCISFVVMEERGIRDALTADRHFRQAGFRTLRAPN